MSRDFSCLTAVRFMKNSYLCNSKDCRATCYDGFSFKCFGIMEVATIGFFDGVHKGHQFLLHQVVEEAVRMDAIPACVTFSNLPRQVVEQMRGKDLSMQLLTTCREKESLLRQAGIQLVRMLDFTSQLAMMSAYDFMSQVLKRDMNVRVLVIGYDHRFGHGRNEGFEDYVRYGQQLGIRVIQARAYEQDYITISSSLIRQTLLQGRVAAAAKLLGYDYSIEGTVVGGFQVGRKIGYPTANIRVPDEKLIPCDGVYAVLAEFGGTTHQGMLNIGWRPTFNGNHRTIEVNLFDFEGNLYSEHIRIRFIDYLRPERKFDSAQTLIAQLDMDEHQARSVLNLKS